MDRETSPRAVLLERPGPPRCPARAQPRPFLPGGDAGAPAPGRGRRAERMQRENAAQTVALERDVDMLQPQTCACSVIPGVAGRGSNLLGLGGRAPPAAVFRAEHSDRAHKGGRRRRAISPTLVEAQRARLGERRAGAAPVARARTGRRPRACARRRARRRARGGCACRRRISDAVGGDRDVERRLKRSARVAAPSAKPPSKKPTPPLPATVDTAARPPPPPRPAAAPRSSTRRSARWFPQSAT